MNILVMHWIIILVLGFILARSLKAMESYYSGIISLVIGVVISYVVHSFIIASGDFIWALIAISYASFCAGMFSRMNY